MGAVTVTVHFLYTVHVWLQVGAGLLHCAYYTCVAALVSSIQNTHILPEQHSVCSHLAELHQVVLLLMELLHSLVLQKQLLQQPAHLTVCGLKGENIGHKHSL